MNERVMTSQGRVALAQRRWVRVVVPAAIFVLALAVWELVVRANNIPHYILPSPTLIAQTFQEARQLRSQPRTAM